MPGIDGVSVIIVTHKRNKSLKRLLRSLLKQDTDFPLEFFLINNYDKKHFKTSGWFGINRILNRFEDLTILNSSKNLGCSIRYTIANYAKYSKILLLDDDLELLSELFIKKMVSFHEQKEMYDIASCWCAIFKPGTIDYFNTEGYNFEITDEAIEVDLAGPGISMFNKALLSQEIIDIPQKYRDVDNVWFSIIPAIVKGSKKYYFPSKGLLRFVHQNVNAMYNRTDMEALKRNSTRELTDRGYKPVLSRKP